MQNKLQPLLNAIDDAIEASEFTRAIQLILTNWYNLPDPSPLRERVAIMLASVGRKREAVEVYELVARHYANAGYPTRSLAAIKQMHALQPDSFVLLDMVTALYNIRSPHLTNERSQSDLAQPAGKVMLEVNASSDDEAHMLDRAVERAIDLEGMVVQPLSLPALPLLSLLPAETLRRVLDFLEYEIFAEEQPVVDKVKHSGDLLWTASSDIVLPDLDSGLRLPAGALLGLNGFGQAASAHEYTTMSQRGSEVLRLSQASITRLSEEFPDFQNRLATLRRHALTEGLLCRHTIFEELSDEDRTELAASFVGLRIAKGDCLIYQGEPSPGLFIILDGSVDIVRNDDDWEITIASLSAGDVVGEVGLVSDSAAIASVIMTTAGHVLHLAREDFANVVERHPSLARYAVKLANERINAVEKNLSSQDLAEME
ncbi:MAG: cyclic nucleotide-binding domain-containing protein [Bradymonadaceae bacterium]|nr:cyclic nucleotide-binding domain-containing protein [Lujinxingiaceae bacterium]